MNGTSWDLEASHVPGNHNTLSDIRLNFLFLALKDRHFLLWLLLLNIKYQLATTIKTSVKPMLYTS